MTLPPPRRPDDLRIILATLIVLAVLAWSAVVQGQCVRVVSHVRECDHASCRSSASYGTGTIVGRNAGQNYVITAAHVVSRRRPTPELRVTVQGWPATVVAWEYDRSRNRDLALLRIAHDFGAKHVIKIGADIQPGDNLRGQGFPRGGDHELRAYVGISDRLVRGQTPHGVSGGPIVDRQARLRGVVWGTDGETSSVIPVSEVSHFLQRYCPPCVTYQRIVPAVPAPAPKACQCDDRMKSLEAQLTALRQELRSAQARADAPITVRLRALDADGNEVVTQKDYPRSGPVILDFRTLQKKEL